MNSIQLAAKMQFAAAAGALPKRFSGLAYSGKAVHRGSCVIDVASTAIPRTMALCDTHDTKNAGNVIGLVDNARRDGSNILVDGAIYSDIADSPAERIAQRAARGFPYQLSVGVYDFTEEVIPAGNRARVNGQDFAGPICVLRNGRVREASVCVLGADGDTNARFFHADSPSVNTDAPARAREVEALFAELRQALGPVEKSTYLAMPDGTWRPLAAKLRLAGRMSPQAAFSARASAVDAAKPVMLSAISVYAARRAGALNVR